MVNTDSQDWRAYYERALLFQRANALSIKVGLVIVPLLFGAGSVASFYYLPESINAILGWVFVATGILLFLFILIYANRAKRKLPYALVGHLLKVTEYSSKMHETARMLTIKVHDAYELIPGGKGDELIGIERTEVKRLYVLKKHETVEELLGRSEAITFICVPNGQIVAYTTNGILTEHTY